MTGKNRSAQILSSDFSKLMEVAAIDFTPTQTMPGTNLVGASLLAKAVGLVNFVVGLTPSSRTGSLPQGSLWIRALRAPSFRSLPWPTLYPI
ncbi:hypothetical protein EKG40_29345 [Pseudomonas moorei]|nr:hypothetical protein EKG40_29345 [Pseudomonas moorei]